MNTNRTPVRSGLITLGILAAAQFGMPGLAHAEPAAAAPQAQARTFASIRHVDAGDLNVGYVDEGPANGPVVILLHGWPYDIHSYIDVVPVLTKAGYRVLVPYLRGYGSTRFRDPDAVRNGEPAALASDLVAFMDALKVDKAILAGYD
jgi:alpha-beta hydrolase superfamily lysophospholipase